MDDSSFDTITRLVGTSRRDLLRSVGISALGAVGFAALLGADEAEANNKGGKKRRRRRCKPKPAGSACTTDKDCCVKKTKRVCGIPFGGSEGDPTVCCGETGTSCEVPSDCCAGFDCGPDGTCIEVP
jgi:hypothetical protein